MANIVYYDLNNSPFFFEYNDLTLYFSSEFYLNKFKSEYEHYLELENLKVNYRYQCNILAQEMMILSLYKIIEKKGFKVYYKDKEINKDYSLKVSLEV